MICYMMCPNKLDVRMGKTLTNDFSVPFHANCACPWEDKGREPIAYPLNIERLAGHETVFQWMGIHLQPICDSFMESSEKL